MYLSGVFPGTAYASLDGVDLVLPQPQVSQVGEADVGDFLHQCAPAIPTQLETFHLPFTHLLQSEDVLLAPALLTSFKTWLLYLQWFPTQASLADMYENIYY